MMKKIILSIFTISCMASGFAQTLLNENFNFTTTNIANSGWSTHSGTVDSIATTAGLTYAGYVSSGIGNAANVIGAGYDYNKPLSSTQYGNGNTIYISMLVNFTQAATTPASGGYFFHTGKRSSPTSFTSFCARLFAKTSATGVVNIGVSNSIATGVYSTTNYSLNTTYLVILKYKINTTGNDTVLLWVKSSGVPSSESAAGTPDLTFTSELGQDSLDAIAIRQAANIPDLILDGIRVANTWADGPLPVKLISFSASLNNNQTELNWSTASETNNKGFEVEKSIDGDKFETIGFVRGIGNSNRINKYSFIDANQSSAFYRLKQIDFDGQFEYSSMVKVNSDDLLIELNPNPFNDNISISSSNTIVNAEIIDILGKTKILEIVNNNKATINTSVLSSGVYFIRINDGQKTFIKRIIKN
jgi:hypothetical protein